MTDIELVDKAKFFIEKNEYNSAIDCLDKMQNKKLSEQFKELAIKQQMNYFCKCEIQKLFSEIKND